MKITFAVQDAKEVIRTVHALMSYAQEGINVRLEIYVVLNDMCILRNKTNDKLVSLES